MKTISLTLFLVLAYGAAESADPGIMLAMFIAAAVALIELIVPQS